MTKESLSLIGVRLVAIYLVASGIVVLPNLAQLWIGPPADSSLVFSYVIAILSPLVAGILLYAVSVRMSKLICGRIEAAEPPSNLHNRELHGIALSIAGLMIIAFTIPDLVGVIVQINQTAKLNDREAEYMSNPYLLSELAVLVLALSLFAGARFWVNLYRWFQEFGLENK